VCERVNLEASEGNRMKGLSAVRNDALLLGRRAHGHDDAFRWKGEGCGERVWFRAPIEGFRLIVPAREHLWKWENEREIDGFVGGLVSCGLCWNVLAASITVITLIK
jgi:hypothetical protein